MTLLRHLLPAIGLFLFVGCADYQAHTLPDEPDTTTDEPPTGKIDYSTFMVGDLGYDYERGLTTLGAMVEEMPEGKKKSTLLLLGDIIDESGLRKDEDSEDIAYLDALIKRLQRVPGKIYYTPGENELGRNSKFGRLDRLSDYLKDNSEKKIHFMPDDECSGPDDEEIFDNVGLIGVSTAWYFADWRLDEEVSEGCDYRNRDAFQFALADEIKGYRDKVKIVMMHHPLRSNGNRGGNFSLGQQLFPLRDLADWAYLPLPGLGSIVRGIQSVGGGRQDLTNLQYREFINKVEMGIDDEENVIFVSGHEHNMMLTHEGEFMQIVAGSGNIKGPAIGGRDANYVEGAIGFSRLDFYDSGQVYVGFYTVDEQGNVNRTFYRRIIDDRFKPQNVELETVPVEEVTSNTVKGPVYGDNPGEKGRFYEKTFGRHYRPLYYTDVEVPVLMIDTINGGLNPYRRGGGMTTMSLHTRGGDGRLYQLRSVRKNPAQLLPGLLETSFAADLAKDQFTAIHPYAPLTLPPLQQKLDLLAADPGLFYVPKQPALGDYNVNFGGEMYWLEQRPDEDWSGTRFFGGSKEIIGNDNMREELLDDWKNYVDQENYARARLFDFWIGDWDRHRDQWRWAAFEAGDGRTRWVGIGRDRDQVFSDFDGNLLGVARIFVPEARKLRPFGYELDKARWRALNGKWNDRRFLSQLTKKDFIEQAEYIQNTITEEDIDQALAKLPKEVRDYSLEQEDIDGKLKSRLDQLDEFAEDYYANLAHSVDVLGTGQDDVIIATGLPDGSMKIEVFDANKEGEADEKFYERTFIPSETREVIVYGMDGDDRYILRGENSGIRLRLVGGTDDDIVTAEGKLNARVYDEKKGMELKGNTGRLRDRRSDNFPELNEYDFQEYYPNYTVPIPALGFNVDDGLFIGAGFQATKQGFKADPYQQRHTVLGTYSTNNFYKLKYDGEFNNVFVPRSDVVIDAHYFSPGYVANFFGLGNEGVAQPDEGDFGLEDDQLLEFNRARRRELRLGAMLRLRGQRNRLAFTVGPFYEAYDLDDDTPDFALIKNTEGIPQRVFDNQTFGGFEARLQSNNVAIPLLADNGIKYDLFAKQSWNLTDDERSVTKFGGQFTLYRMLTKAINFATRIGFEHNEGQPEYYQLAIMGGRTNYRAARADRYRGNTMFYQNIDLRFMGFSFGKGEVPTVGGFLLGLDHGRVWLEGEDSDVWHFGYGGGVWVAPLGATILSLTYFLDDEAGRINFAAGFPF